MLEVGGARSRSRPPTHVLFKHLCFVARERASEREREDVHSVRVCTSSASQLARSSPLFSIGVGQGILADGIAASCINSPARAAAAAPAQRTGVVLLEGDGPAAVLWRVQVSAIGYSGGAPRDFVLVPRASGIDIRRFRRRRHLLLSDARWTRPPLSFLLSSHMTEGGSGSKRTTATERAFVAVSEKASACYSFFPCFVAPSPRSFAASSSLPPSIYPLPLFLPSCLLPLP